VNLHDGAGVELILLDLDGIFRNLDRPEETAARDARVEIVNLVIVGNEGIRVLQTLVEIESNKAEGPLMAPAVDGDVLALHEAVITVEDQARLVALAISADPDTSHHGHADDATEIEDGRGFLARATRYAEPQKTGIRGNRDRLPV
jgi:hypothetical protein